MPAYWVHGHVQMVYVVEAADAHKAATAVRSKPYSTDPGEYVRHETAVSVFYVTEPQDVDPTGDAVAVIDARNVQNAVIRAETVDEVAEVHVLDTSGDVLADVKPPFAQPVAWGQHASDKQLEVTARALGQAALARRLSAAEVKHLVAVLKELPQEWETTRAEVIGWTKGRSDEVAVRVPSRSPATSTGAGLDPADTTKIREALNVLERLSKQRG